MRVYLAGEQVRRQPRHTMFVSPANDLKGEEVPADWVDDENRPVNLTVEFKFGAADVADDLGRYLVKRGLAVRTKLILPRRAA